ncbi:MAG: hypothetical protein ACJ8D4_24090 [Xanthobacteraceae bacterium]
MAAATGDRQARAAFARDVFAGGRLLPSLFAVLAQVALRFRRSPVVIAIGFAWLLALVL